MAQPLTDAINALTTYANTVTGASDTTLSDAVATLASGYGQGGDFVINMKNVRATTTKWQSPVYDNTLPTGGSLEVVISGLATTTNFPNILDFGGYTVLATYNSKYNVHIYYNCNDNMPRFIVRQDAVNTNYYYDDSLPQHTIKIDKDYIYIDGTQVVATMGTLLTGVANAAFGSQEGSTRFTGTYNSIIYK